ncbi:MAG TPA: kelch repeat-containing protein [Blastocatellia bacterium]|nr:kelch repeat-containing protein [Blastocatellia bacterium]
MRDQVAGERTRSLSLILAGVVISNLVALPFAAAEAFPESKSPSQIEPTASRKLSLEQRINYQRRLEAVNWRHRIWPAENPRPKPALDEVLPQEAMRTKVEDYLRKSAALATYWHRPITAEQLQAEINRLAAQSKQPERLAELFAALDNDAFVIAECLARPLVADRLVRNWYAYDERFHGELKSQIEADIKAHGSAGRMRQMSGVYSEIEWSKEKDSAEDEPSSTNERSLKVNSREWNEMLNKLTPVFERNNSAAVAQLPLDRLSKLQEGEDRYYVTAILSKHKDRMTIARVDWEKRSLDIWWQSERRNIGTQTDDLAGDYSLSQVGSPASACTSDTWTSIGSGPFERDGHTAVWTGTEMIVWGGRTGTGFNLSVFNTGSRYNPATDTWNATSTINAPAARRNHTAVWTGSVMIVWGGNDSPSDNINNGLNTGGRYSPSSDTWSSTSITNAPGSRDNHKAIWTGAEMIVWGGSITVNSITTYFNTGGRYNPSADGWTMTSTSNAPDGRHFFTAVWTGGLMIIWGGFNSTGDLNTGGRYNPASDSWLATNTIAAPETRRLHAAVWTGTEMIIASGVGPNNPPNPPDRNTGGRYDPLTDTWFPTSTTNAPSGRNSAVAWTGAEMIVWGGFRRGINSQGSFLQSGARYNPSTNNWTAMNFDGAPAARELATAVWDTKEVIIWGGSVSFSGSYTLYDNGGRYDPSSDTWVSMRSNNTPLPRRNHTALWTGVEMILWGGQTDFGVANTGARYSPATDSMTPTSLENVPTRRMDHTAVWTGTEMIVWGGREVTNNTNTGGRYNPASDLWIATDINTAPFAKTKHTAVWTGTVMIVWGGIDGGASSTDSNTGFRYDPTLDSWTAASLSNAPPAREVHTAVWTGSVMVVWGGLGGNIRLNTGGRYDPSADTWNATDTANAPTARYGHTAVWTGSEMIVWGGDDFGVTTTGARYNPSTNSWIATGAINAPAPRRSHTAVWTGTEMIVWGGDSNGNGGLDTGGRYNPATDGWLATGLANVPSARFQQSAVFTGREMIVWGGNTGILTETGARYCVPGAASCNYIIAPMSKSFPGGGGSDSITVNTQSGCNWTAVSNAGFITITSGSSGSDIGVVNYSVSANAGPAIRSGTITVAGLTFTVFQGIDFADVPSNDPFYSEIGRLAARGVTVGCGGGNYCPNAPVLREQMAAFIMRAKGEFNPPTPASQRFADVTPSNVFYNFIDRLAELGITVGCGGGNYCPSSPVLRMEMAAFMLRGLGEFNPPTPLAARFNDVPPSNVFFNFIDRMAVRNITLGCTPDHHFYCPGDSVTRAQMAAFLVRAFNL